jgi:predicted deacylase
MKKSEITLTTLPTGQALTAPVFTFEGSDRNAPSVYIQASLHGSEVQGNAVIYHLWEYCNAHPPTGDITVVPLCNPYGISRKAGEYTAGRFDPTTGDNWNRTYVDFTPEAKTFKHEGDVASLKKAFRAYMLSALDNKIKAGLDTAQLIAARLQQMTLNADLVLDLHTGEVSDRHLYAPSYTLDSTQYFNVPFVLSIDNGFDGATDEAVFCPWWTLAQARNLDVKHFGVEAFTLEVGSQEMINFDAAKIDAEGIVEYLKHQGALEGDAIKTTMKQTVRTLDNYKTFHAPTGGLVEYAVEPGEHLEAGQVFARILNINHYGTEKCFTNCVLDYPAIAILRYSSAVVPEGAQLYRFFKK